MACALILNLRRTFAITAAILSVLVLVSMVGAEDESEQILDEAAKKSLLEQEVANALIQLKRSLEKDGFYSSRIALNIWQSAAMDAGTFDQAQYDEFKKRLYEKSVNNSRRCFEEFLLENNFHDANICLQIWRMHSKDLGTYNKEEYEVLKARLADAKAGRTSAKAEEQKPD